MSRSAPSQGTGPAAPHHMPDPPGADPQIAAIIGAHRDRDGALLPILHDVQAAFGYIPAAAHGPICDALNISGAELRGVVSFYHDFRARPSGRHVLRICRSEACQAVGGRALEAAVLAQAGVGWGQTTPDGALTIEAVYCLGLCACGPAAMLDNRPIGRVDPAGLSALLAENGVTIGAGTGPRTAPRTGA